MMALYGGGRPGSSRQVHLVPVRQSSMDHRAVARIVLALARQMAMDEAVESAADDEVVSSGEGTCSMREPGTRDVSATGSGDAAVPWAGVHSGQSARGVASVERCAHQRPEGAHYSAHGLLSTTSHALPDHAGAAETDESAAASSTLGGTP